MDDLLKCGSCGFEGTLDDFDVIGACHGNVFCNTCGTEVDSSSGEPKLLCGECWGCQGLKESGAWEQTQLKRRSAGAA